METFNTMPPRVLVMVTVYFVLFVLACFAHPDLGPFEHPGFLKRLVILVVVIFLVLGGVMYAYPQTVIEIELRRGATGTVRFDTQNQKFMACLGSRCQEVHF